MSLLLRQLLETAVVLVGKVPETDVVAHCQVEPSSLVAATWHRNR